MPHTYGSEAIPLVARPADEPVTDHALHLVGQYLQAAINARAQVAWSSVAPSNIPDGDKPVRSVFTHDPADALFSDKSLPAIYLFRSASEPPEDIAEDWRIERSTWTCWWIYQRTTQAKHALRAPFMNGLRKVMDFVTHQRRDPSFIISGDADPLAAKHGSLVFTAAKLHAIRCGKSVRRVINIPSHDGDRPNQYDALEVLFEVEERLEYDLAEYDLLAGADLTVTTSSGFVTEVAKLEVVVS